LESIFKSKTEPCNSLPVPLNEPNRPLPPPDPELPLPAVIPEPCGGFDVMRLRDWSRIFGVSMWKSLESEVITLGGVTTGTVTGCGSNCGFSAASPADALCEGGCGGGGTLIVTP
jgi:hypothetical protein